MQIGDKLMLEPTVFGGGSDLVDTGPRPCRVVWIHPLGRYFVVEFRYPVTGERFRETIYFTNCISQIAAARSAGRSNT